jgi:hypothetical protein
MRRMRNIALSQASSETKHRYRILAETYRSHADRASDDFVVGYLHLAKGYEALARLEERPNCPLLDMFNPARAGGPDE